MNGEGANPQDSHFMCIYSEYLPFQFNYFLLAQRKFRLTDFYD